MFVLQQFASGEVRKKINWVASLCVCACVCVCVCVCVCRAGGEMPVCVSVCESVCVGCVCIGLERGHIF